MTPNAQIYLVKLRCYGQIIRLSDNALVFLGNDNRSVERLHPAHGVQVDEIPDGELAGLHQVVRHR